MNPRSVSFGFVLMLAGVADVATGAAAAQERWVTYANARFGTAAEYPVHLFTRRDPPPENGDGQGFRTTDDRAHLLIYGAHNAEGDTPQSYLEKYVDREGVTFRRVTARFYVVSGTREGEIFYERCNFPARREGIIDCFTMTYPAADKAVWDAVVARVSRSLRNGRAVEPR